MRCLLPCMVTAPHIMARLERMLDYRGVGLARFHCIRARSTKCMCSPTKHSRSITDVNRLIQSPL